MALTAPVVMACSCMAPADGVCGYARPATLIFTGRVKSIDKSVYTFEVKEALRGGAPGATVEVTSGGPCGADFALNIEYLVFAFERDGRVVTGACSGSGPADAMRYEISYLKRFGASLPPVIRGSISNRTDLFWPVAGATVRATGPNFSAEATTSADGQFEFPGLSAGLTYQIEVKSAAGRYQPDRQILNLRPESCVVSVPFIRSSHATLEVRLIDAVDDAYTTLVPLDEGAPKELEEFEPEADDYGMFRYEVPAGRYRLGVKQPGENGIRFYEKVLELADSAAVTLEFKVPKQ